MLRWREPTIHRGRRRDGQGNRCILHGWRVDRDRPTRSTRRLRRLCGDRGLRRLRGLDSGTPRADQNNSANAGRDHEHSKNPSIHRGKTLPDATPGRRRVARNVEGKAQQSSWPAVDLDAFCIFSSDRNERVGPGSRAQSMAVLRKNPVPVRFRLVSAKTTRIGRPIGFEGASSL